VNEWVKTGRWIKSKIWIIVLIYHRHKCSELIVALREAESRSKYPVILTCMWVEWFLLWILKHRCCALRVPSPEDRVSSERFIMETCPHTTVSFSWSFSHGPPQGDENLRFLLGVGSGSISKRLKKGYTLPGADCFYLFLLHLLIFYLLPNSNSTPVCSYGTHWSYPVLN
jgi:hypothetical protein